jgi:integrase
MARVKLTAGRIATLTLADGVSQAFLWDTDVQQLAVRVTAGEKSYIFQSRIDGRSLRLTIGKISEWSIDAARKEARLLQMQVDKGVDPREQKKIQRAKNEASRLESSRRDVTLTAAWTAYIAARKHKWGAHHLEDHERSVDPGGRKAIRGKGITSPGPLAALMPLKMAQIDANRIKAWLSKEAAQRPTRADLAFRLFRAFLNWCESVPAYRGIVPADAASNRMAKDVLPKKSAKDDCLQREQLQAWFGAVRRITNPTIAAYLQILLLTGTRRESLAALKWEDIDFHWNSLTVRDKDESKGGEDGTRVIPLTPYVAALLSNLKRINETPPPQHRILHGKKIENDLYNWQPSPWVFTSKTAASGRLTDPTQAHYRACAAAAIEGLTLHGLRRSFATLSEWIECPTGVVAQIMGHKPSATAERHYKRRPIDLLRMWHTKIEAWMLEQAGIGVKAKAERKPRSKK